eukprot:6693822-Heterocapsa_arctica.AAC.1
MPRCLWECGLLPLPQRGDLPPPTPAMDYAHKGASLALKSGTIVYTDGSAVFPRDLPMRRAAYGIWLGYHNQANFASALPGK